MELIYGVDLIHVVFKAIFKILFEILCCTFYIPKLCHKACRAFGAEKGY